VEPSVVPEQELLHEAGGVERTFSEEAVSASQAPASEQPIVDVTSNEEQSVPSSPENSSSSSSDPPSVAMAAEPQEAGGAGDPVHLGDIPPFWVPDGDADACMNCDLKFTTFRRRHHCRACGKVMCAKCCNGKAALAYMERKVARVCSSCLEILQKGEAVA
jgi:MAD (mothers against decapentaplegic) interacting protein